MREWLALPPALGQVDLRGALYVGREHAPLVTASDRLSSAAADLLRALVEDPQESNALVADLAALPRTELSIMMDRVLARARQVQEWGAPPILDACIALATADPNQGRSVAGFLIERPGKQIQASIVPKIESEPWAAEVLKHWAAAGDVEGPVKKVIEGRSKSGNIAK